MIRREMIRSREYILDPSGINPIPCDDAVEWCKWFGDIDNRKVANTPLRNHKVSTVFLGLDYSFSQQGKPIVWETMVFNSSGEEVDCARTSGDRWDALRMHEEMLSQWQKKLREERMKDKDPVMVNDRNLLAHRV